MVRVTRSEREAVHQIAAAVGLSISEVVRHLITRMLFTGKRAAELQQELFEESLLRGGVELKNIPKFKTIHHDLPAPSHSHAYRDKVDPASARKRRRKSNSKPSAVAETISESKPETERAVYCGGDD